MKHNLTRMLCLILAAVLLLGMLPAAFAEQDKADNELVEEISQVEEADLAEDSILIEDAELVEDGNMSEDENLSEESALSEDVVLIEETDLVEGSSQTEDADLTELSELNEDAALLEEADLAEDAEQLQLAPMSLEEALAGGVTMHKSTIDMYGGEYVKVRFKWNSSDSAYSTASIGGISMHYIGDNRAIAYCIEPGVGSITNTTYYAAGNQSSTVWSKIPADKKAAIGLAILYGAPSKLSSTNTYTEFGYECATQLIIWEFIMGLRSPIAPYDYISSVNVTGSTGRADALYENMIYTDSSTPSYMVQQINGFKSAYATIISSLKSHRTVPSFATTKASTAKTYEMAYDAASGKYTISLADTNGVLEYYSFSGTGVTVTRSGNTLKLTADRSAVENGITLSAQGKSLNPEDNVYLVWECDNRQTIMTTTTNPDPVKAYFKLKAAVVPGTMTMQKTAFDGNVEGFRFRVWASNGNKTWCGISDADGQIYQTDENFAQPSTKVYTFDGLLDGDIAFRELIKSSGKKDVFPDLIHVTVTNSNGAITYDHYFMGEELNDDNGDCVLTRFPVTGLTGGGKLTFEIRNRPLVGLCSILKSCPGGPLADWRFRITDSNGNNLGVFTTGSGGEIFTELAPGTYIVEELLDEDSGYICTSPNPQTITISARQTTEVRFENIRRSGSIRIQKINHLGQPLEHVSFLLEALDPETQLWNPVEAPGLTDGILDTDPEGFAEITDLPVDRTYRLTEIQTNDGYQLLLEPAFQGTLEDYEDSTVSLTVVNNPIYELPATGGQGFHTVPIGILGMLLCLAVYILIQKKGPQPCG